MKENVFCAVPQGVDVDENFDCFKFVKPIYRIKQTSRGWEATFYEFVCSIGFQFSEINPCLDLKIASQKWIHSLVYVDDVLMTGSSIEMNARTEIDLQARFEMTDMASARLCWALS